MLNAALLLCLVTARTVSFENELDHIREDGPSLVSSLSQLLAPAAGKVHYANTEDEFDTAMAHALSQGQAVIAYFTASWCGPCQMIAPYYEMLAASFPHVLFLKVDVDANPETAQGQGIRAMPTFKAFKNGQEVGALTGADQAGLKRLVETHQGDRWSSAGAGHTLGGGASTSSDAQGDARRSSPTEEEELARAIALSLQAEEQATTDREKRLAALAKRGLQ